MKTNIQMIKIIILNRRFCTSFLQITGLELHNSPSWCKDIKNQPERLQGKLHFWTSSTTRVHGLFMLYSRSNCEYTKSSANTNHIPLHFLNFQCKSDRLSVNLNTTGAESSSAGNRQRCQICGPEFNGKLKRYCNDTRIIYVQCVVSSLFVEQ